MATTTMAIDKLSNGLLSALMYRNISVAEAVRITGLCERTIRSYIASGKLNSKTVGRRRLIAYLDVVNLGEKD